VKINDFGPARDDLFATFITGLFFMGAELGGISTLLAAREDPQLSAFLCIYHRRGVDLSYRLGKPSVAIGLAASDLSA
jgi:hypothetical protein